MEKEKLLALRHSCEHVLTMAMLRIWGNKIKAAMGPATDDGFYFDFDSEIKISESDFEKIEKEMAKIIKEDLPIIKDELSVKEARKFFDSGTYKGNEYKHEWIDEIERRGEKVSVYWMGEKGKDIPETFVDICAGPHVESTKEIGPFKLTKLAGAYWHGDEKNKMLTRIYGVAFETKEELDEYLRLQDEIERRDHRKIGAEQELFAFSPEIGQGLVLWLPNGNIIKEELEKWAKETEEKGGYQRVTTPIITKEDLFFKSEHLPHYKESMYSPMDIDGENYYIKPMNCPFHHTIFKTRLRSYRELPLRLAEYGWCHRYEDSGSLFGLMRVRGMQMNDSHIYCTKEQAVDEFVSVIKLHEYYYQHLGIKDYYMELCLRNPENKKYHGDDAMWKEAEALMREAMEKSGVPYVVQNDGAAFYGPKVDFQLKSVTGRVFTASTNQIDLFMPKKFDLKYVDSNGQEQYVACIHRAPLGTHERFVGFLIEHYAGIWPVWLSPMQVLLAPVATKHQAGAKALAEELRDKGIRVEIDDADETVGNKVRKAVGRKIPYIVIVGDKELSGEDWMIRVRGEKDQVKMSKEKFVERVMKEIKERN